MDREEMTLNKKAWLRYMARSIDITLGVLILSLVLGLIFGLLSIVLNGFIETPLSMLGQIPEFILGAIVVCFYLIIEASFFSSFKTSLGKKLFGISITDKNNNYLEYGAALKRNLSLWFRGMALSIPFLSLIAMANAYQNFTDKGITSWDEDNEVVVHYKTISSLRMMFAILLFIVVIAFNTYMVLNS